MQSTIGLIAAFALLMWMIMKGFSIYLTVFSCALVVAVTCQMNIYDTYKVHFMTGFTNFFKNNFLIFLTGTLLAKAMDITGAANSALVVDTLCKEFAKHTMEEIEGMFARADIAYNQVQHIKEVLEDPQALENMYIVPMKNNDGTVTKQPAPSASA